MGRQGFGGGGAAGAGGSGTAGTAAGGAAAGGLVLGAASRRFLLVAAVLVASYFATAPLFYESAFVDVVAGWIAATGGGILAATGATVTLYGPIIRTAHGAFIVTQECIFTPLIPLYVAAAVAAPIGWRRRTAMLVATPVVFFAAGGLAAPGAGRSPRP